MIVQSVHGYLSKGHAVGQATVSHIMEQTEHCCSIFYLRELATTLPMWSLGNRRNNSHFVPIVRKLPSTIQAGHIDACGRILPDYGGFLDAR